MYVNVTSLTINIIAINMPYVFDTAFIMESENEFERLILQVNNKIIYKYQCISYVLTTTSMLRS